MAGEATPSATSVFAAPPLADTDSSAPPEVTKKTVVESADHCGVFPVLSASPDTCCTPVSSALLTRGDGAGVGAVGVDGWVTKVMVCGWLSGCWLLVSAPGPMVTWYCVFGARSPL